MHHHHMYQFVQLLSSIPYQTGPALKTEMRKCQWNEHIHILLKQQHTVILTHVYISLIKGGWNVKAEYLITCKL